MICAFNTYNRINYATRALEALVKSIKFLGEPVKVLVSIDYSEAQSEMNDTVLSEFSKLDYQDINVLKATKNLGCNRTTYELLDQAFHYDDYVVFIEDDILLAKDALYYFKYVGEKFKPCNDIFTVDGYNNGLFNKDDYKKISISKSFKPWGWATWKNRWSDDTPDCPKNNFKVDYHPKKHKGIWYKDGTWDCYMKKCVRGERCRVFPLLPRSKNIGEIGAHTPSKGFHAHKHTVPFWSDDLPVNDLYTEYSISTGV